MIDYSPDMVRRVRKLAGLTLEQAGSLVGVSGVSISLYENHGNRMSRATARALVKEMAPLALAEVEERKVCPLCGK